MTIIEAVKEVMRRHGAAMTVSDIYEAIIAADLYTFHADNPPHIVANQIRRHCLGLDFPTSSQTKHFRIVDDNKYYFLETPTKVAKAPNFKATASPDRLLAELKALHGKYQEELKRRILEEIKRIEPENFEHFSRRLLQVYGFTDMVVTPYTKDGGLDGHGKLKVGLAYLNVAFQCKRWNKNTVGRPEIDRFRGAIQGQYEQGLLFTTGSFASGAEAASFRSGAVPIILIDGPAIVELMIEKQFGVQVESVPIYSYALDLELGDEE
jgi:restriction system protein